MNTDLSAWDVSKVGTLAHTFQSATKFAGTGLETWKTGLVTTLSYTFHQAGAMNVDFGGWNVAKVATLASTFSGAGKFAGTGLETWKTGSVTTLSSTFSGAGEMNADLSGWDVSGVTTLSATFSDATSLTSCNKRKIADEWNSSTPFFDTTTPYNKDWIDEKCTVRSQVR
jgi:surface protein